MLTKKTKRSNHFVLSVALTLAIVLSPALSNAQQLRQGISVQMPPASSAASMPEADNENAWIVTATVDGSLYSRALSALRVVSWSNIEFLSLSASIGDKRATLPSIWSRVRDAPAHACFRIVAANRRARELSRNSVVGQFNEPTGLF